MDSIVHLERNSRERDDGPANAAARARALWQLLENATDVPPAETCDSLAEQLVRGIRLYGARGIHTLAAPLDAFASRLPPPIALLDAVAIDASQRGNFGFSVSGVSLPSLDTANFYYIQCPIGSSATLQAQSAVPSEALVFMIVGKAHYRTGIPARVHFSREGSERAFELGIGAEWLISNPPFHYVPLKSTHERILVVIAHGNSFAVYCDGLKLMEGVPAAGGGWRGVTVGISPHLAPFGDLLINRMAVWGVDEATAARLEAELDFPGKALDAALIEDGEAGALARMLRGLAPHSVDPGRAAEARLIESAGSLIAMRQEYLAAELSQRLAGPSRPAIEEKLAEANSQPIVKAEKLVVELETNPERERRLARRLSRKRDVFRAVDGVDFSLNHGDVLGIIGHNGAGKSTLLRALCGLIDIHQGRITIADRFLLLRPGMGMRDELTGRENIYSMGFYLGLELADVRGLMDDIIEFSELGSHIDKAVKYYSDGMRARLSFSIATSFAPEVLFLDELLGAGDISFQEKAQARLRSFIKSVGTVVVVTHSMQFVTESCTKALLMHGGKQVYFGDPQEAVARFMFLMET